MSLKEINRLRLPLLFFLGSASLELCSEGARVVWNSFLNIYLFILKERGKMEGNIDVRKKH